MWLIAAGVIVIVFVQCASRGWRGFFSLFYFLFWYVIALATIALGYSWIAY